MLKLHEMKTSPEALNRGLRENALRHKNYNMYTAMDRAMCLLLTGNLYISDGQTWNDKLDRDIMKEQNAYGICMSCSTIESMAMWMLYSGDKGRNGALIRFLPFIIGEIISASTVELGTFDEDGKFINKPMVLNREQGDFDIFMTDVLYTDVKDEKADTLIASLWEDHEVLAKSVVRDAGVFHKHYAWSYERECRLIVSLSSKAQKLATDLDFHTIRIHLSDASVRSLKNRIVRSPVYTGKTDFGEVSTLNGKVDWNL